MYLGTLLALEVQAKEIDINVIITLNFINRTHFTTFHTP